MVRYEMGQQDLTVEDFLQLVQSVWPGAYDPTGIRVALSKTLNVCAWDGARLVGCVRILSDGYLFGTITEILVAPQYRRQGIGSRLMALAWDASPTSLFFGSQPGNETFFENAGFSRSIQSFGRKKPRG